MELVDVKEAMVQCANSYGQTLEQVFCGVVLFGGDWSAHL